MVLWLKKQLEFVVLTMVNGTNSGMAIIENGSLIATEDFNIEKASNLKRMYQMVRSRLIYWKPDIVAIEKVNVAGSAFGGNNVVKLAEIRAMIKLACLDFDIPFIEVSPPTLKKAITGYGKASKREVAEVLASIYNLDADDICKPIYYKRDNRIKTYVAEQSDAIALAHYVYEKKYAKDYPKRKFVEVI